LHGLLGAVEEQQSAGEREHNASGYRVAVAGVAKVEVKGLAGKHRLSRESRNSVSTGSMCNPCTSRVRNATRPCLRQTSCCSAAQEEEWGSPQGKYYT
jgi:hypothetical protein